jgi:HTH-type transcriptional regulator, sugar sensing transcriptional regulator
MLNIQELEKIGLTGKKAKVYLAVLEVGQATVIQVARKTLIKRTTLYDIVADLTAQGYLSEIKKGNKNIIIAEDPAILIKNFERRLDEVKDIAPALFKIFNSVTSRPQIRFYEGVEGIRHLMEESLVMKEKEVLYWGPADNIIEILGNVYVDKWLKRRIKAGIKTHGLLTQNAPRGSKPFLKNDKSALREVRWLSTKTIFDGILWLYDNKVMYIASAKDSFGFIIESDNFTSFMKVIFQSMWETAREDK